MKKTIKFVHWWVVTLSFMVFVALEMALVYWALRYIGVLPS
jgi:hypothetical protein